MIKLEFTRTLWDENFGAVETEPLHTVVVRHYWFRWQVVCSTHPAYTPGIIFDYFPVREGAYTVEQTEYSIQVKGTRI